jgi:hypothetical protein
VDNEEEYEADHIFCLKKNKQGRLLFLICWKGYGPDEDSWEPASNLKHVKEVLNIGSSKLQFEHEELASPT